MRTRTALIVWFVATSAVAASNRIFVSGSGMDIGTCPITAPCRSFSYAISQVAPGGEIIALDTAGYGVVTINFAVTIVAAPGATAFIAASSGNAITVNGGANDVVTLRGLALSGAPGAQYGVSFSSGPTLNVEKCIINGFDLAGIYVGRNSVEEPQVRVIDSVIRNGNTGIFVFQIMAGKLAFVTIANSAFTGNISGGVYADQSGRVVAVDSVFAGNYFGLSVTGFAEATRAEATLDRCTLSRNHLALGVGSSAMQQVDGIVRIANCRITGNDMGVNTGAAGQILSRISNSVLTNTIEGNGVDGSPTGTFAAK